MSKIVGAPYEVKFVGALFGRTVGTPLNLALDSCCLQCVTDCRNLAALDDYSTCGGLLTQPRQ
jgi:hypothetical protein